MKYVTDNKNPDSLQRYVCDVLNNVYGSGLEREKNLGTDYEQVQNAINFLWYNYSDYQKGIDSLDSNIIVSHPKKILEWESEIDPVSHDTQKVYELTYYERHLNLIKLRLYILFIVIFIIATIILVKK